MVNVYSFTHCGTAMWNICHRTNERACNVCWAGSVLALAVMITIRLQSGSVFTWNCYCCYAMLKYPLSQMLRTYTICFLLHWFKYQRSEEIWIYNWFILVFFFGEWITLEFLRRFELISKLLFCHSSRDNNRVQHIMYILSHELCI